MGLMMVKKIFAFTVLALVILIASVVISITLRIEQKPVGDASMDSSPQHGANTEAIQQAEQWLSDLYSRTQLPSFSVAIGVGGDLVWAGAVGQADLKNELPATTRSKYRIGSVSKPLTAAALMKISEQGNIQLDKLFSHYVTDFDPKYSSITVRDLASHQAGIRHYPEGLGFLKENFSNTEYPKTRDAALMTQDSPLLYEPGKGFQYSTHGYTFLSLAMEQAYGKPFEQLMTEEVFTELGMTSTAFDKSGQTLPEEAAPYLLIEGKLLRAPKVNLSYKYAAGGYLSTPTDLVKFGNALLNNTLLKEQSKNALWTPQALDNGDMNYENYALGFRVGNDELGEHVHHGGKSVGGYAYFVIYPEHEVVIALMTNATPAGFVIDRAHEARALAKLFVPQSL
jgi:serine beta-lactamase-like protein LACTB